MIVFIVIISISSLIITNSISSITSCNGCISMSVSALSIIIGCGHICHHISGLRAVVVGVGYNNDNDNNDTTTNKITITIMIITIIITMYCSKRNMFAPAGGPPCRCRRSRTMIMITIISITML